ncbi:MAG: outer membrane protein assembly factor BamA [Gallionellaceae bacterium]|nr:outer membrane protein assembly factor BamA [Gallionellaceae bacterium]
MTNTHKLSVLAAALLIGQQAWAFEPFEVKDIRVEGIQRTEAGTVFSYLPVKVGETLTEQGAARAIESLYATGFFKDVRLEHLDGVLVILVEERPAIAQVEFNGMKEFPKDDIKAAFKQLGLSEGRILDRALLDKAEQELKRQYFNRGLYSVQIQTSLSPLERNRTAVTFDVVEGEVAKIRSINIVGAKVFKEKDLVDLFSLRTPGWMTWISKNDQYSKQKLAADLETLRSHYLDRGYLEFRIDSTQVSITPDKKDIYLTINVSEGDKYTISGLKMAGNLPYPEAEFLSLVTFKPGDAFSREKLNASIKGIGDRLGNDGYAFANVNAAPEIDREKKEVAFTFLVDPGRKVYVNRINIAGNSRTQDEVIRREMRQMEGGWYAVDKINRSRERIDKLGYFKDVTIETPPVPGSNDQVDINVSVTEQSTGSLMLGAGFSSSDGVVLSGGISQNNLFGTGNRLSLQMNSGSMNTHYSLSFTQPYFTPDGISMGYDLYRRDVDTTDSDAVVKYSTSTLGAGVRLGVPIGEYDAINLGAALEQYSLDLDPAETPQHMKDFAIDNGGNLYGVTVNSLRLEAGWSRDRRDSFLYPTKGSFQKLHAEMGTPVGDLQYYKLSYQYQWLRPVFSNMTLMLNGELGWGGGLGDNSMPFFRNFYAGGIGSVRGFDNGTLGPKVKNPATGEIIAIGGDKRIVGNAELMFPFPGSGNDRSLRMSAFVDAGAVWGGNGELDYGDFRNVAFGDLRVSAGLAVTWLSPMGPIKLSIAKPLRKMEYDEEQLFQFQMGQIF